MSSGLGVSFSDLGFAYNDGKWVFRNCSAEVSKGEVLAILGANGQGKTTLVKVLAGILTACEGNLAVSAEVAFVPQQFRTVFDYRTIDIVLTGRGKKISVFNQPTPWDFEVCLGALARFGIEECALQPFDQLSGGQRQLALIARALASDARILVLDEPTAVLDFRNQALVLECLTRLSRQDGLTIIFTTHHPDHALAVADKALLMRGRSDHLHGPVKGVLSDDRLTELYGIPILRVSTERDGRKLHTIAPFFS